MRKLCAVLVVAVLLVGGCATEDTAPEAPEDRVDVGDRNDDGSKKDGGKERADEKDGGRGDGSGKKPFKKDGGKPDDGRSGDAGSGNGDDATGGDGSDDGGGAPSTSAYPAAGTYTFAQKGYEEFCDTAGNCDKQRLPSRQPVKTTYESRSGSSAVVVTEQKASQSRLARTWTRFTPSGAHITKVYVRFEYSGFRFERTYVPEPSVEALRFPFDAGSSWSGRWRASTSGSYQVEVGAARSVPVGNKSVKAFPVATTTEFRGDFEGRSKITTYIDPRTKAIVAAKGVLNVTSQFGRYSTLFETGLVDGPGY